MAARSCIATPHNQVEIGPLQTVFGLEVSGVEADVNALIDERLTVAIAGYFGARQDESADDLFTVNANPVGKRLISVPLRERPIGSVGNGFKARWHSPKLELRTPPEPTGCLTELGHYNLTTPKESKLT